MQLSQWDRNSRVLLYFPFIRKRSCFHQSPPIGLSVYLSICLSVLSISLPIYDSKIRLDLATTTTTTSFVISAIPCNWQRYEDASALQWLNLFPSRSVLAVFALGLLILQSNHDFPHHCEHRHCSLTSSATSPSFISSCRGFFGWQGLRERHTKFCISIGDGAFGRSIIRYLSCANIRRMLEKNTVHLSRITALFRTLP